MGVLVRNELQTTTLIQTLFSQPYNLNDPNDVGLMIFSLENTIDAQLQPDMFDYISGGMKELVQMGVSHAVESSAKLSIIGDSAFDFIPMYDRLALDYINRVGVDGKRLSDRIWSAEAKNAITKEVYESIKRGDTVFTLAQNLEKVVTTGTPRYYLKRIAETELTYAYAHAKADILLAEMELFGNVQGYIRVSLSPVHNIIDICDALWGTYKVEDAPLPAFHPNCLCVTETFLRPKGEKVPHTTIEERIKRDMDKITVDTIETATGVFNLPSKKE